MPKVLAGAACLAILVAGIATMPKEITPTTTSTQMSDPPWSPPPSPPSTTELTVEVPMSAAVSPAPSSTSPPPVSTPVETATSRIPADAPIGHAPPPVAVQPPAPVVAGGIWGCIIRHESGGDPTAVNRSSGASGLVQFMDSTWHAMGMAGKASQYAAAVQLAVAARLQAIAGWYPWRGDGCTPVG